MMNCIPDNMNRIYNSFQVINNYAISYKDRVMNCLCADRLHRFAAYQGKTKHPNRD